MVLLTIVSSSARFLNRKLIFHAARKKPSLIIDCANCANPHLFYPNLTIEDFNELYVIELELLYKFRDVLLRVPSIMKKIRGSTVVVTTSNHLFNYQDELENRNIIEHSWEIMEIIGKRYDVIAGITFDSVHLSFAKKYSHKLEVEKIGSHCS